MMMDKGRFLQGVKVKGHDLQKYIPIISDRVCISEISDYICVHFHATQKKFKSDMGHARLYIII